MIDYYETKGVCLFHHQAGICSGCGRPLYITSKPDMAHWLARTKKNMKNYPLFIDSILNMSLQHNPCNVGRLQPKYKNAGVHGKDRCTHYIAERYERFLERHPAFARFVNNPLPGTLFGK